MEQKVTEENRRPIKEANRITKLLDLGLDASARYPVNVEKVALELTPLSMLIQLRLFKRAAWERLMGCWPDIPIKMNGQFSTTKT